MGKLSVEVVGRAPGLAAWLSSVAPARARGTMTVAIVSDARVRALNRTFRKTDRATDVLSFPAEEPRYLGDVVISSGLAARQARAAGHSLASCSPAVPVRSTLARAIRRPSPNPVFKPCDST